MLLYRAIRLLLRVAVRVFFRRVEVVGREHIPAAGVPTLFAGNHPNSLLDPVLVIVFSGRLVHFAAKDVLFKSRILRFFLEGTGAVPIRRRKDHGGSAIDNDDAFTRLYDVLGAGRSVGIFPEGISHDESQLSRLKTGAARVAFGTFDRHPGKPVNIVPVGLHYVTRDRFRSSVLVQFGEPIVVDAGRAEERVADDRGAVRQLTDELEVSMRALTVNADDWDTVRVLDGVRRLYQPQRITLEQRVELARRFNFHYPSVRDEPMVKTLLGRVRAYLDHLSALGLEDRDVRRPLPRLVVLGKIAAHIMLVLFWLPLAAAGAPVHIPIVGLLGVGSERLAPRKDVIATTKFVLGLLLLLLLYGGITAAAAVWLGPQWTIPVFAGLVLSGWATLVVLGRFSAIDRKLQCLLGTFALEAEILALGKERAELETSVIEAVDRFRPDDLELLFPERLVRPAAAPEGAA